MTDQPDMEHRNLEGEREYEAAIDEVIDKAERTLHIFDIDLQAGGYQTSLRFEKLRNFLAKQRGNKLVMVLYETGYLLRRCPRLMNLLKIYSHAITVLQANEHGHTATDPFVIADEAHYVHRFHIDSTRALLAINDHPGARELEERFGQLLETALPGVSATTLGL